MTNQEITEFTNQEIIDFAIGADDDQIGDFNANSDYKLYLRVGNGATEGGDYAEAYANKSSTDKDAINAGILSGSNLGVKDPC